MPRLVALDVGDATIGVAASDELNITANPIVTIRRSKSIKADLRAVVELLSELEAGGVIIGLPLNQEGEEGPQAAKVREFSERLAKRISIPIEMWDERFSTYEAEQVLIETNISRAKRREIIDKMAAAVILQSYMDNKQ